MATPTGARFSQHGYGGQLANGRGARSEVEFKNPRRWHMSLELDGEQKKIHGARNEECGVNFEIGGVVGPNFEIGGVVGRSCGGCIEKFLHVITLESQLIFQCNDSRIP